MGTETLNNVRGRGSEEVSA